eukprot:SAG31_NODE_1332_length_8743_cov_20.800810_5_plen_257_part_00
MAILFRVLPFATRTVGCTGFSFFRRTCYMKGTPRGGGQWLPIGTMNSEGSPWRAKVGVVSGSLTGNKPDNPLNLRAAVELPAAIKVDDTASGIVNRQLGTETVILVMAHNRPQYLQRCLEALLMHHPAAGLAVLPIVVSEDRDKTGGNAVEALANDFAEKFRTKRQGASLTHMLYRDQGSGGLGSPAAGYARLARHYKWALSEILSTNAPKAFKRAIIVEEDLQIADDFFEYFAAMVLSASVATHWLSVYFAGNEK